MSDDSTTCADWTDRKLYTQIDAAVARAMAASAPGERLGHLAAGRALLSILAARAEAELSDAQA